MTLRVASETGIKIVDERVAMVCPDKDCNPRQRSFLDPKWKCPTHGKAVRQPNRRYFGQRTPGGR